MKKHILLFLLLHAFACSLLLGQKKNEKFQYHIHQTSSDIKIDGVLDEKAWQETDVATDFFMVLPMDTSKAKMRTEVRLAYDKKYFYISAVNFQDHPVMVESFRRDWNFGKNDNFIFFLDPFDDQTNGFSFGANAAGAEWDGQQFDGGSINLNWDNRWRSAVKQYDDRWVFEAAIPFKTLRYKKDLTRWGINFSRNDLTSTEKSSWAPVPRQFPTATLAFTGVLVWDTPPPKAGQNISLIPYALGGGSQNFQPEKQDPNLRKAIGMDAKVAVTSSLNLDMTINPDFSQVEVDNQQTNLDRFELFFPERRQFFLENSDLFNNLGFNSIRPFFSRRIGLNVPIQAGARFSGRINKNWRLGIMDMQTKAVEADNLPAQNFGVMTVQRRVLARSNVTAFYINRQSPKIDPLNPRTFANRNGGAEFNFAAPNEIWRGKMIFFKSFNSGISTDDYVAAANIKYNNRRLAAEITQEYVGNNYNPEVGFVPRRGYHKTTFSGSRVFFPKKGRLLTYSPGFSGFNIAQKLGRTVENETAIFHNFTFKNRAQFTLWTANNYIELLQEFDPTNFTGIKLPIGSRHIWYSFGTSFDSKPQRLFTFGGSSRYGGYYAQGTRLRLAGYASYRVQPFGSLAMTAEYNDIRFPVSNDFGLKNTSFWLIGPRLDVTLSKKIYFTTFLQYNEQAKNVNLNTRFQWRYAPASDLFFVYTDNYLPDGFEIKNKAFVLKMTYWWNL